MSTYIRISTRPPIKQSRIVSTLRSQIVNRELTAGSQLPTRSELEKHFQVSAATIQRAIDHLVNEGFVWARGSKGTFVVDHPPHQSRFALVFPQSPLSDKSLRFWMALYNEAMRVGQAANCELSVYCVNDPDHEDAQNDEYRKLLRHAQSHRLAGIIFATPPYPLAGSALLKIPDMPRVAITTGRTVEGVSSIRLDSQSFLDKALDRLASLGRKRIAVIVSSNLPPESYQAIRDGIHRRGMILQDRWMQGLALRSPAWAKNVAELLMSSPPADRPDGLLIADDNFVEHAASGLVAGGVRVPQELDIVAHCNFPWPTPSVLPVMRLGYDTRDVLQACLDGISRQRRGEVLPKEIRRIEAVFEDELNVSAASDAEGATPVNLNRSPE